MLTLEFSGDSLCDHKRINLIKMAVYRCTNVLLNNYCCMKTMCLALQIFVCFAVLKPNLELFYMAYHKINSIFMTKFVSV